MRGHLGRIMIKDFLHDMLGDVTVDQGRAERYLYRKSQSAW
jgi:hypothetical protein